MIDEPEDLALLTLLAARSDLAPGLSEQLVRRCYEIERKQQFNTDRAQVVAALDRLIEHEVDATIEMDAEKIK